MTRTKDKNEGRRYKLVTRENARQPQHCNSINQMPKSRHEH